MFFTGDSSSRKRVNLGGRSSKEPDRQKVVEQTRLERQRRLWLRQQNAAALKIQKCFRGRRAVALQKFALRRKFFSIYGSHCQKLEEYCFAPDSEFLSLLLYFFNAKDPRDFDALVETCRRLLQYAKTHDVVNIVSGGDYSCNFAVVDFRLKRFSSTCLLAIHQNRYCFSEQILMTAEHSSLPIETLLEAVAMLINPCLPWVCKVVNHLAKEKTLHLVQEIFLSGMSGAKITTSSHDMALLERVLILIASHTGQDSCSCQNDNLVLNFSSEILSIPFIWKYSPHMKEVFATEKVFRYHIKQIAVHVYDRTLVLPHDTSRDYPGSVCLLGNLLEISRLVLSQPGCSREMVVDFTAVASYLLETVPPLTASIKGSSQNEDEMDVDDEDKVVLNLDLQSQILKIVDSLFLEYLVNALFKNSSSVVYSSNEWPSDEDLSAIGGICYFLHVSFLVLPHEFYMTGLAYRTEIVLILWSFIKWCHKNSTWPSFSKLAGCFPRDAPGWLLPLAVFCPVYKYMLTIIDNEEFYEQEKPLSLKDIKCLVIILKQVLWELLWFSGSSSGNALINYKSSSPSCNELSVHKCKSIVRNVTSDLLNQLQDWNNRRSFMSSSGFHAHEALGDSFISQALTENSRARDILMHAPFLIPFASRVKIFMSHLATARGGGGQLPALNRYRFRIRRNQLFDDAFAQLNGLSEEELRATIRITFINELGAEEPGIDGGGLFKDFIESIAKKAFDVQYGLFKETSNHLLYPNPGSGMIHQQHLQFFHFLGVIIGKAMFEGILIDIPFATFFLSKLKQKHNYLNDLPSLDPELYRHLLFLKHYEGDVSNLELYFVVVNNDYGEQTEDELLPGGKNMRVTRANVITFIHLVANYRLNFQMRHQSLHFLRGFQRIIEKEWIDMFSEHEIQLLISGSTDGMDVDDLRSNAQYSGGYHEEHPVILMLWEVIKYFSKEHQMKFLKFVTGCSRGPLLGFKYLEPKFCIQRAAPADVSDGIVDRLPTAATCMNLLKLPPYLSKEQLREKILYAINADAGFDLS